MSNAIIRPLPLYMNGQKVAEVSSSTENRSVNAANNYGIDGVIGQSIGADETKIDFDLVVPVLGTQIPIDLLIGVPVSIGIFRNATMMLTAGVIASSDYTSDSKSGEAKGKFSFIGGAPQFIA